EPRELRRAEPGPGVARPHHHARQGPQREHAEEAQRRGQRPGAGPGAQPTARPARPVAGARGPGGPDGPPRAADGGRAPGAGVLLWLPRAHAERVAFIESTNASGVISPRKIRERLFSSSCAGAGARAWSQESWKCGALSTMS